MRSRDGDATASIKAGVVESPQLGVEHSTTGQEEKYRRSVAKFILCR